MKYIIEGEVDFFKELLKSEDNKALTSTNNVLENNNNNNNICLITCELLTDKFIVMDCGHKFNYVPLYKDIYNHKKKYNRMESGGQQSKINEIRCPYCRNIQKGVLPYYEELGLEKVHGVNTIISETKPKDDYIYKKCDFILNEDLIKDENENENVNPIFCSNGIMIKKTVINDKTNEKCYCVKHKKMMIAKEKKMEKQEILQAKIKAKAAKLLLKNASKSSKPNKSKMDELNAEIQEENVVLAVTITCNQILKSGPNKGSPCSNKVFENGLCKRHCTKNLEENL
jgi:hypothetical protein